MKNQEKTGENKHDRMRNDEKKNMSKNNNNNN